MYKSIIIFNIYIIFLFANLAFSFQVDTHEYMNNAIIDSGYAFNFSINNYLQEYMGFQRGVDEALGPKMVFFSKEIDVPTPRNNMKSGGETEDLFPRFFWHFHDPYFNRGLGLYESTPLWAQKNIGKQYLRGNYSWNDAGEYFYKSLISPWQWERELFLKETFRSVGQLMHLVQDMAVPEHARNDPHAFPGIEYWLNKKLEHDQIYFSNLISQPFYPDSDLLQAGSQFPEAPVPIANLFDTNTYLGVNPEDTLGASVGLSEYTNANFFSADTLPVDGKYEYPHPTQGIPEVYFIQDPVNPAAKVGRMYYVAESGNPDPNGLPAVYRLSVAGAFQTYKDFPGTEEFIPLPILDEQVYEDYAKLLLPKAVGYSAALMSYFFRGQIEVSLPNQGLYSIVSPDSGAFDTIRLKARNVSLFDEEMPGGSIELVVRYKRAFEDPFQGVPVAVTPEFIYQVVPEKNGVTSIPRDAPVELVFELSDLPIPLWATDLSVQLVYRGRLGKETSAGFVGEEAAVAVGFKDLSEPTPIDYVNGMDVVCLNDEILLAGSDAAVNALDASGKQISSYLDVYPHYLAGSYLKFSPQAALSYASPTNYEVMTSVLLPGHYSRIFILTEPFSRYGILNERTTIRNLDSRDPWLHATESYTMFYAGMINQAMYENGSWIRYFSGMHEVRGMKVWTGIQRTNQSYPYDTTCDEGQATIPLVGPEPLVFFQN